MKVQQQPIAGSCAQLGSPYANQVLAPVADSLRDTHMGEKIFNFVLYITYDKNKNEKRKKKL